MKYFRKRRLSGQNKSAGTQAFADNDPLTGLANLFDIGLVFIVGLLLTLFSAYRLNDLFDQNSDMTIMKQKSDGEMEIITKKGTKVTAMKVSRGRGERLGTAYRLQDGSVVYVPDTSQK